MALSLSALSAADIRSNINTTGGFWFVDMMVTASGGTPPYTYTIDGGVSGGGMSTIVVMSGTYAVPNTPMAGAATITYTFDGTPLATFTEFVTFRVTDNVAATTTSTMTINYTVNPPLSITLPTTDNFTRAVGGGVIPTVGPFQSLSPTGGTPLLDYIYATGSITLTYGNLSLGFLSPVLQYTPTLGSIPNFPTVVMDTYNGNVSDYAGDVAAYTYTAVITVVPAVTLAPITSGSFTTNVGHGTSTEAGLLGTAIASNGIPAYTYEVVGGTPGGGFSTLAGTYGSLSINQSSGAYTYTKSLPIGTAGSFMDSFTIRATGQGGTSATQSYTVFITVNPDLLALSPPNGAALKYVNGPIVSSSNLSGTLGVSGGSPPFTYGISGGTVGAMTTVLVGTYGTLTINNTSGAYNYVINTPPNTVGMFNDNFTFTVDDTVIDSSMAAWTVVYTVDPELIVTAPVAGSVLRNAGSINVSTSNLSGTLAITGGAVPYNTTIQGGTNTATMSTLVGSYGTLFVTRATAFYSYSPFVLGTAGGFIDNFMLDVTDNVAAVKTTTYTVNHTINAALGLTTPTMGTVFKFTGGSPVTANLSGTLVPTGGTAGFTFGILGGVVGATEVTLVGSYGTLAVTILTGAYVYTVGTLPTMVGVYNDNFSVTVTDSLTDIASAAYNVQVTVSPALAVLPVNAITVTRNVGSAVTLKTNTSGMIMGAGGTPPYDYTILGGATNPTQSVISVTTGTLFANRITGNYFFSTANLNTPGVTMDTITLQVTDQDPTTVSTPLNITYTVNPALNVGTPTQGQVIKFVGDVTTIDFNLTGVLAQSGGTPPITFDIQGGSIMGINSVKMGLMGTLTVNRTTGAYFYTVDSQLNTQGTVNDDFMIDVADLVETVSVLYRAKHLTFAALSLATPAPGSVAVQIGNPTFMEFGLNGTLNPGSGQLPYTFGVQGGTVGGGNSVLGGLFGNLSVNTTTGAYAYTVLSPPGSIGTFQDIFTVSVTDAGARVANATYTVTFTAAAGIVLMDLPEGSVTKSVNGVSVTESNLMGTVMGMGIAPPATYTIRGGTDMGISSVRTTSFGTLSIIKATGVYTYIRGTLPNTVDMYTDSFIIDVIDLANATASVDYKVNFAINAQLLIGALNPSAGSVTRNTNTTGFESDGLSGTFQPVGGLLPYTYGIQGSSPAGPGVVKRDGQYGSFNVGVFTGTFSYAIGGLPTLAESYADSFVITVVDDNGETQTLEYAINFIIAQTPIALLPVFTDAENRSEIRYWNFIIHNDEASRSTVIVNENTEIVVVGETTTTVPTRDPDLILKTLLRNAIETSEVATKGEDIVARIKTNTQNVLDTGDREGALTYSFSFPLGDGKRVVELADILSNRHNNFFLNRYRANVAESALVFYYTSSNFVNIANQVKLLNDIDVGSIVLVLTGFNGNPATSQALAAQLRTAENMMITTLVDVVGPTVVEKIIRSSVRFNVETQEYVNIFRLEYQVSPTTVPLYTALSIPSQSPRDATRGFRCIIIAFEESGEPIGEVTYGAVPLVVPTTYVTSKPITASGNVRLLVGTRATQILGNADIGEKDRLVFTGPGTNELQFGDMLYSSTFTYQQPQSAVLYLSVVEGVQILGFAGSTLFMQVGDGVRFPFNPVFATAVVSIDKRFDSDNLQELPVIPDVQHGFDYVVTVNLPTNFVTFNLDARGAATMEEYTAFPRIGHVTLYFGRSSQTGAGITPFGRAAILSINRS